MGKIKEQCIEVMELIDDGVTPRQAALYMGMSVEEVTKIMEFMGYYDDPTEFDYVQT
jgi:hypothetical protein